MDYIKDSEIDPNALEIEWLNQTSLGMRYAKQAAEAKRKAALAEERVKVTRADLIRKVADDPVGTTGKEKPTAQDIEAWYRSHPDHKQAKEDWIEADYQSNYATMAQMEISLSRKAALENLVRLHGQQYFAGPKVPRDLSKEWEERKRTESSDEKINEAMKERRLNKTHRTK